MARYYDMDKLAKIAEAKADTLIPAGKMAFLSVAKWLELLPAADVVPRSEVDKLEYTLLGVMHCVDKWLDGDELEQDEVNRAITMREKTLRIIETIKTDTAKAIFEEIESLFPSDKNFTTISRVTINRLKKKYTEVSK